MEQFEKLFGMDTKDKAKKFCERDMEVSLADLLNLITECSHVGLKHAPKFFKPFSHQPLTMTDKDKTEISDMSKHPIVWMKKCINAMKPQASKHVVAHFFDGPANQWHCFYWVGADIQGAEGGKVWGQIEHIHYTSHLFNIKRDDCEARFTEKGAEGIDKAHVKFKK